MIQTLKTASLELNNLNNNQVVKIAGIVRRLKNWYKKLTNPEYKDKLLKLKTDSAIIKNDLDELNKYINAVQSAIKDSDVESYNFAIDRIKEISQRLSKELENYKETAKEADPDPQNKNVNREFSKDYPNLPPSLERIKLVHISNTVRTNVWNIKAIKAALERHNVPADEISNFVNDPSKIDEFYNNMAEAIKGGEIVKSWEAQKSKLEIDRNGELQYKIITVPFSVPGTNYKVQVTVEGTDLSARKNSPKPVFSVRGFGFIDSRQKSSSERIQLRTKVIRAILES